VFLILPKLGAPTTLSASAILGRSLQTMTGVTGVELLEYQLFVGGAMPGPHRIEQLIDHDRRGRVRVSNYGPDGTLESSVGQDPATRRRFHLIRVDGRNYVINLTATEEPMISVPEMAQALIETAITAMQTTSDKNLTVQDTPGGRQYIVEMPNVAPKANPGVFELDRARTVISADDYRLLAFEAGGAVLRQPFTVSFTLIRRSVRPSASVAPQEFEIAPGPGDVVLTGVSADDPVSDVLTTVLRELGRVKGD
jgi:hypothetical protein